MPKKEKKRKRKKSRNAFDISGQNLTTTVQRQKWTLQDCIYILPLISASATKMVCFSWLACQFSSPFCWKSMKRDV